MAFTSYLFFGFFIICFLIVFINQKLFKKSQLTAVILLLFSMLFILYAGIVCMIVMLVTATISYITGLALSKNRSKLLALISISVMTLMLVLIKLDITAISVVGISFYTFSSIAYVADVYKEKYEAVRNPIDYYLYISFFPKWMSGPIVRPDAFIGQVKGAKVNAVLFEEGIQKVVFGYFKKAVIADRLGLFVNQIFLAPNIFAGPTVLLGIVSYSLQIYFDFSGYSDIAIGLSKMLGFRFDENFDIPYRSRNLTEFWRRWHISLSSWLRDYIYIPLGGNRRGIVLTYINLMITMLIGGLWHGMYYTFIIWGALHGVGLVIHKVYSKKINKKMPAVIAMGMTFIYVSFCWIFFNAKSLANAIDVIKSVTNPVGLSQPYTWSFIAIVIALVEVIYGKEIKLKLNKVSHLTLLFTLMGLTFMLAYIGNSAFIYNGF